VAEVQRARLLGAAVRAVDELGWTNTSVSDITRRARVSRRTFYELFANCDDCLAAVIENTLKRISTRISNANLDGLAWRERVRRGLWEILCFFEDEPALARFCVVQSTHGGQRVLECRERIAGGLARIVDEARADGARNPDCPPLTADGVVGATVWIIHAHVLRGGYDPEPLTGLLGELMSMIVLPYQGPAMARKERVRPSPPLPVAEKHTSREGRHSEGDMLQGLQMRLTYRTVRVLQAIADQPGTSNRTVRRSAGIADDGQMSKLLARLQRLGLIHNTNVNGHANGEPNQWALTVTGLQVTDAISAHAHNNDPSA
jgi:AcrR family transcriptional regulator